MAKKKKSVKPAAVKTPAKATKAPAAAKGKKPAKKTSPAAKTKAVSAKTYAAAIAAENPVRARVAALQSTPLAVCHSDSSLQATLGILKNTAEPIEVRLQALRTLQAASFSVIAFEPCRKDYVATLREVASDPDPTLRQRVLGILARDNDAFAQKKLLEGLKDPSKALVPPEKALQLLGNNPHAGAFKVAREIVATPPNSTAKREALRLLAADTKSADLFEQVLGDKGESTDVRQISASALHALQPDKLQSRARDIVLDAGEDTELQSACLTALANFGDPAKIAADSVLINHVSGMAGAAAAQVNKSASQFLKKYGQ